MRTLPILGLAGALSNSAFAGYTAVVLPLPAGHQWAVGNGVASGVYAGYSVPQGGVTFRDERAILWRNGQGVDVTPLGYTGAQILNSRGIQHVGSASSYPAYYVPRAYLWKSDGSSRNLHPPQFTSSVAFGVGGGKQVGTVQFSQNCFECGYFVERHAVLWSGSASSAQLLHAPGSGEAWAYDTNGTSHVGFVYLGHTGTYRAALWNQASDYIDLHPSGFLSSFALGVQGTSQVGWGETPSGSMRALLWRGSASSAVNLHPSSQYELTIAYGVYGNVQVGAGRPLVYGPDRALAWGGSASSVVNLHRFLPVGFRKQNSTANDVDHYGNIVGTCGEDATGRPRAVVWIRS